MRELLIILAFGLFFVSCKPVYNLTSEKPKIVNLVKGNLNNDDYLSSIPNSVKDSIPKEKLYKHLDSVRNSLDSIFFKPIDIISQGITINKISSTRRIDSYYFKIIEFSNSLEIQKNESNLYLYDYKEFLNQNLINYSDDVTKLVSPLQTNRNGSILAYWEKEVKEWKHLPYSDLYNEKLFSLKSAQKIIELYFEDIFIDSKVKWDKESISIFSEAHEEERNNYEGNGIDFEKFLKCRMKYQQRAEEKFNYEIPDEYYESAYFIEHSIKCRIYSKKIN